MTKKTMFYLPDDLHRFLAEEADGRGVSMAEIAREAIGEYRVAHRPDRKAQPSDLIGIWQGEDGLPADFAARVDEYLDEMWGAEHDGELGLHGGVRGSQPGSASPR